MLPRFHFSIERWRKNIEYGVWVSNQGRVKLIKNRKYLEPRIDSGGYCSVFTQNGIISVHRLVAYTWMGGKRNEKYTVDHINSNKRDNSVKNLRWVEEDINRAYAEFIKAPSSELVETHPQTAIEEDETLFARMLNVNLDEKTRGRAVIKLLEHNKVNIRTEVFNCKDFEALTQQCKKLTNSNEIEKFVGRITKVANKHKLYCNHFWFIERT